MQFVPHTFLFGTEVIFVVWVRFYFEGNHFGYFQSVAFKADTLDGVIGHKAHFAHTYATEHLCAYTVITFIGFVA